MKRLMYLLVLILLGSLLAIAQDSGAIPAQAARGKELFLNSAKGVPCGTCHTLGGVGTAVGPDLKKLASLAMPRGLVMAMQMTVTEYVQEVKVQGATFSGIQKQKTGDDVEIWDLSKLPPTLRKFTSKEVLSMTRNDKWKHPPASAGYTSKELADLIGWLKWASMGSRKEIKISDIEVSQ
jgi:cytochrome c553